MMKLNFEYNNYGTYSAEGYFVEFHQGEWHCFRKNLLFGPSFTYPEAAMNFCQRDAENA